MNFLENIFERLARAPGQLVIEEMRKDSREPATAGELLERVAAARAFLTAAGLQKGDRCALLAPNSIGWAALDLAAMAEGIVIVPLYARQAAAELVSMLRDADVSLICCGDAALREAVLGAWPTSLSNAPATVLLEDAVGMPGGKVPLGGASDTSGAAEPISLSDADPVTIIYTSGTSGEAKGVILNVGNVNHMLACTSAQLDLLRGSRADPDKVFHYLPFCFAGSWILLLTSLQRLSVLRLSTDLTRLASDLHAAAPDYCQNVSTLLERMRAAVEAQITKRGGLGEKMFVRGRAEWLRQFRGEKPDFGGMIWLTLARSIVFPSVRSKLGPSLRALICGSAPLALDTQLFFMMLGIPVLQAYGLTETTALCTMDNPGHVEPGTVGPTITGTEMKLGEGDEILVRGPHVFTGYWNKPEETSKSLEGGWFHTGDRGERTAAGNWRIIGRLKNLLVLNSGHNVAPEPLEEMLAQSIPGAQQVMVVGHGRSYLTALVAGGAARERVESEITRINKGLPHYRQVRAFHVEAQPLTIESGLLTANGKLRRDAITTHFKDAIEAMYQRERT